MLTKKQESYYDWVFYQIYPRSFKDSNGDGIGDLNGITEKLDYLKQLGVNAVWLSPCYKSPNDDNGYDISDYRDIMDEFGTMDDWKRMIDEMHKRDIKLIMDFVANHTSSEHRWFKEARKSKDNPYRDYYYWADEPLNDWRSAFGGSAWEYDDQTGQYYLHSYAVSQPDLNWENPKVREEMLKVVDFWVDLGVDGFRCDVLDQISKDFENNLNGGGPRLHEYINLLFGREKTKNIFTVGECWGANEKNIKDLIDGSRNELSAVFQFDHACIGHSTKFNRVDFSLDEVRDIFVKWQNIMQKNEMLYMLFLENHDLPRCVSKYGNDTDKRYESATMLAAMYFLQKGVPFIYQGQEIGVTNNVSDKIEDYEDIEAINYYNENINIKSHREVMNGLNYESRDHARHPMPWNSNRDSGFGSDNPWFGIYNRYKEINAQKDIKSDKSVYRFYQKLINIRKSSYAVRHGIYEDKTDGRNGCYIYKRADADEEIWVICNFEKESILRLDIKGEVLLTNTGRTEINGKYQPYECAVIRRKKQHTQCCIQDKSI